MGDQEGALESFRWYESEFPDDSGDPMHCLCWTLCLYRARETAGAAKKLHRTMLLNLYIIPLLLDEGYEWLNMWHGSNTAEPPWAEMTSPEFLALWTGAEKKWVGNLYHGASARSCGSHPHLSDPKTRRWFWSGGSFVRWMPP